MNYTEVIETIKGANLFDLYRLNVVIRNELECPERIEEIKRMLREGEEIEYFNEHKIYHSAESSRQTALEDILLFY